MEYPFKCRTCGVSVKNEEEQYARWPYCIPCGKKRKKEAQPGQTYPFPCNLCGAMVNSPQERYQEALRCFACGRRKASENMQRVTARARGENIPKKPFGPKPTQYPFPCKRCGSPVRNGRERYGAQLICRPCGSFYRRDKSFKARYGISLPERNDMETQAGGVCAICGEDGGERGLVVDHDHKSGNVRKLLCYFCNWMLGYAQDDIGRLYRAIEYLKEHADDDINGSQ